MTLAAIVVANRARRDGVRTFGLFRLEILAALVNAVLLFASAIYVLIEAVIRLVQDDADVKAGPMLVVAILGLLVNIVVFMLLRAGARDNLAMESAYTDAIADAAGSVGVIVAAVVVVTVGWDPIDPIVAALIALWILPRAWALGSRAHPRAAPGRTRARRPRQDPRRAPGGGGRRRRPRSPRVDAHVGDGGRVART